MHRKSIAFISTYDHVSRDSIELTVRRAFPDHPFHHIVVTDVLRRNRRWQLPNLCYTACQFGGRIARGHSTLRDSYARTSYLFNRIHRTMASLVSPQRHAFSFQTQSMFDTSVPGVPHFVYTDHTHLSNLATEYFDRRHLRPPWWLALERRIYANAARVLTRSHNIVTDLSTHYGIPEGKAVCVYAGANVQSPDGAGPPPAAYAAKRILYVGGDWERKGGPVLAEAFREVLKTIPDAHLTIAGASPGLGLRNCTELGVISPRDLAPYFSQSSVFCLPTRLEPFGVAFLDAMSFRLPIVGTPVGAIPELIQEGVNGVIVPTGNAPRLAAALTQLLLDPEMGRRFGEAGYRLVQQRYTWDAVGNRIRGEVARVLGFPGPAPCFAES
jgi:glycosyltransferase involved in cell wall biosynthesis